MTIRLLFAALLGLTAGPAFARTDESLWRTLEMPAAAKAPASATTSKAAGFSREAAAKVFETARKPEADDLLGIWLHTASASDEAARYERDGIYEGEEARLMSFSSTGNPFMPGGLTVVVYVDSMRENPTKWGVSFGAEGARFGGYDCRMVGETNLLCKVQDEGGARFEGYKQTRKGEAH